MAGTDVKTLDLLLERPRCNARPGNHILYSVLQNASESAQVRHYGRARAYYVRFLKLGHVLF